MGKVHIGLDTYIVKSKQKAAVSINHAVFVHVNSRCEPWKIFSRNANESDAQLQQRILKVIAKLVEVRSSPIREHLNPLHASR